MNELEKLYSLLSREGYYTKSFEEFKAKYDQDPEYRNKVFGVVSRDGFFTKSQDDFFQKYAPATEVKKKESTESPSEDGLSASRESSIDLFFDQFQIGVGPQSAPSSFIIPKFLKESIAQGAISGAATDEILQVMAEGREISDEGIQRLIEADRLVEEFGPTQGMVDFYKDHQKNIEAGDSEFWSFVKGVANNPKAAVEVMTSSMARMIVGGLEAPEIVAAGSGLGAAGGVGMGALGGPLAPATVPIGAITGTVKGAMAAAGGLTETTASFVEFMKEELGDKDFTQENIRAVLEDDEARKRIYNRSLSRGATIALMDFVTSGASGMATKSIGTVGRTGRALRGLASTSIEAFGGGLGEAAARVVADQEMDLVEIGFEAIGEIPGAAVSGPLGMLNAPKYNINKGRVSKDKLLEVIDSATDDELLAMDIKIDNDEAMADRLDVRMKRAKVAKNIDPSITDPEDIKRVTELEIQIQDLKNKNTFSSLKRAKVLQEEIVEIQKRYEVEKELSDGDGAGEGDEEQELTVTPVEQAPVETVGDIVNRPVTLTSLGGSPLDTPIQGDLYVDGQQVVVEDSEGNITEIGNFADIADTKVTDMGIEYQTAQVTANADGSLTIDDKNYTIQDDLPTGGLVFDEEGNVIEASVKDETGKPVMFKGALAEDIAYQVLLSRAESPEQKQRITEQLDKDEEFQNILREAQEPTQETADTDTQQAARGNRLLNEPLQDATTISDRFTKRKGIDQPRTEVSRELDEEKSTRIAQEFDKLESNPNDPEVQRAYTALAEETVEQYQELVDAGYSIEINNDEPYANSAEMIEDLRKNKRIKIFSTEAGFGSEQITDQQRQENPMLRDSGFKDANGQTLLINDVFRAVHDFFGHAKEGNSFGPKGEEIAWNVHSRMFSPEARRAMTTETRGQNSWVNFSGVNDAAFAKRDEARALRKEAEAETNVDRKRSLLEEAKRKVEEAYAEMKFAEQKIGLLPDEFVFEEEAAAEVTPEQEQKQSELDKLRSLFKAPDLVKQVENVISALSRLAPNVKVVIHNNEDAYAKATDEKGMKQKSAGSYNASTKTIHINAKKANMRTVYHEAFHAILFSRLGSLKEIQVLTDRMIKAVMKVVPESTRLQLEAFAANYDENIQSEEKLAELFGILASEYKTLPTNGQSIIKRYLDRVAKALRLKQFTDAEVIDLLNTLSKKVATGEVIDTADVNILRDRSGNTEPFGASSDRKQKRTKPDPKKTIKAYKLFRVVESAPGQIFPLFVDANTPVEVGSWIDADMAEGYTFQGVNGHYYIPSTSYKTINERTGKVETRKTGQGIVIPNDKVRQELIDRGFLPKGSKAKKIVALARRPGWHSGDMPMSTHLGSKSKGSNLVDTRSQDQVWAEVEIPADVDWQQEALDRADRKKDGSIIMGTADITDRIPEDGYYKYKTNPQMTGSWIISGSIKVNRILSDQEVAEINKGFGVKDLPRNKPMDLARFGFTETVDTSKEVTRKQKVGQFEVSYFEDSKEFKKLVDEGVVVNNFNLEELVGLPVAIHQPDNMFVGNLRLKSKKIFEGQGGVFYTANTGNFWASGKEGSANNLKNLINSTEVDGVRRMVLVRGSDPKMITSTEGVKAAMTILEKMVDENLIPRRDFRASLTKVGKKYGVDFSGSNSAIAIKRDIEEKFMKPSDSTFAKRGTFFEDVVDDLGKTSQKANENIDKIRDFLGYTGRKISFSKDGIKDAIGNILTERLLVGLPNSHVYAVIEATDEVIVRPATKEELANPDHGSYPYVLVTKDGSKPILKLLSTRPHAVKDNIFELEDGSTPTAGRLGLSQRGMGKGIVSSRKQINQDVAEVVYRAKEEGISDEAIIEFLKEEGLDVEQGIAILKATPKSSQLWDRSNQAIQSKVQKKNLKYYRDVTRERILDRQARIKRMLNGIGSKESLKAVNLLITKAGASGFANFRFKKADEKIFKGLSEEDTKNLDQIIYARRVDAINDNRRERGLDSYSGLEGYSQEDAKRDLATIENKLGSKKFNDLNKRADEYFKVFDQSLERLYKAGLISEEVYNQLKDTEYSPIKTIKYLLPEDYDASEVDRMATITGMNKSVINSLSDENVNEVIMDSRWLLMTNLSMIEARVFENRMLNAFNEAIESADADQKASIEENVLPNPKIGNYKNGRPKYKYDPGNAKVPVGFVKVTFLKDGNPVDLIIRENYAKQLLDIKTQQGFLDNVVPKLTFTNILRFFATSGNPLFIVGNTAVDFANILFLSDVYSNNKFKGAANLAYDSVRAFISKIAGTDNYNKIYAEYMEHGGSMDYLSTDGLKALESLKPKVKAFDAITKAAQAYGRLASYLGETSEISFRLAVYERSKENLIKEFKENNRRDPNPQEMEDIMFAAARESRETIDFSQGGSSIKAADKALPYLNAATQGFRKAVDYANSNPKGFASSMIQGMTMSASFAALSMFLLLRSMEDDEDIEEVLNSISEYEKANYHVIFTGLKDKDGERSYVRIKKLPVISAAATLAEQMVIKAVLKYKGIDYDVDGSVLAKNVENAAPIIPSAKNLLSRNPLVSAVVTYQFNYDMFYDQEVFRGPRNKKIEPAAEGIYDSRVDQIYKDIAPMLGMSPKRTQAAMEKIFTSESTNPMIGLIYSGYDTAKAVGKEGDPVVDEISSAAKSASEAISKKLVRKTNKELIRYKQEADVEKLKMEVDSKTYLAEQKVYSEIRKRYKDEKGTLTNGEFIDLIESNFEPKDYAKYKKKYLAYIKNINSDPAILDIIYETTPEVQARMLFEKFGDSLENEEVQQILKVYKAAGRKISKKGIKIYKDKYEKRG